MTLLSQATDPIVRKPHATMTYANKYTLTERKLLSICAYIGQEEGGFDANYEYDTDEHEVRQLLGATNTNNTDWLKEALRGLNGKLIEWNLFEKDKSQKWGTFTFLQSQSLENGRLKFRLNAEISKRFRDPKLFSRFRLLAQIRITKRHALALLEFLTAEVDVQRAEEGKKIRVRITVEDLRRLLGLEPTQYQSFKSLSQAVLYPAVKEIQEVSDLEVSMETVRQGRSIHTVEFLTCRKENFQFSFDLDQEYLHRLGRQVRDNGDEDTPEIVTTLVERGVAKGKAMALAQRFSTDYIKANLEYVRGRATNEEVKNEAGFLVAAIEKNYAKHANLTPFSARRTAMIDTLPSPRPMSDIQLQIEFQVVRGSAADELIANRSPSWLSKRKKVFLEEKGHNPRRWKDRIVQIEFRQWVADRHLRDKPEFTDFEDFKTAFKEGQFNKVV